MEQSYENEGVSESKEKGKENPLKNAILEVFLPCFLDKTVAFLPNMCYNNRVNENEKGVEAATPTPPIKTNTHFA